MARKKQKINKVRGQNLQTLLNEKKMSQIVLSSKIPYTKEHINSVINGHRNLTDEMARKVLAVEEFASESYEWLMDYTKFRTKTEENLYPVVKKTIDRNQREKAVTEMLKEFALSFELNSLPKHDMTTEAFSNLPDCKMEKVLKDISIHLENSNTAYTLKKSDNTILFQCSTNEYKTFINDICDYLEFKLNQMLERSIDNG